MNELTGLLFQVPTLVHIRTHLRTHTPRMHRIVKDMALNGGWEVGLKISGSWNLWEVDSKK